MRIDKDEILMFAIEEFFGSEFKKINMNELAKLIDKVEEEDNGSGIKLRTCLKTLEQDSTTTNKTYRFSIIFNQNVAYSETSSIREAAILKAIGNYCKDRLIQQLKNKKCKK